MNVEMAYLTGMILGNGEIQRGTRETTITIDIPYKNLYTEGFQRKSVGVSADFFLSMYNICTKGFCRWKVT